MNHRKMWIWIIGILLSLIAVKVCWTAINNSSISSFDTEKKDILKRRNYLVENVITTPIELINSMPKAVGEQFRGEWALYSCSMLSAALVNIATIYPETKEESVVAIDKIIQIVLSPEIRRYDNLRWGEDPLETLDGNNSHISYLSHLAWIIAGYKQVGGGGKYDKMYRSLCSSMNRRILASQGLNLQTYPGEYVYIPDMLVAIVALKLYSEQHKGEYNSTVSKWLTNMKKNHLSSVSGLMASLVLDNYNEPNCIAVKGSYTALSCYYLTFIDKEFARAQYELFKSLFTKKWPVFGYKEFMNRKPLLTVDIDAGPIIFGLSPTGTAFGIGPATYFNDSLIRKKLLRTAEVAGTTIRGKNTNHYLLADMALVGEAITLAMRTATEWN